MAAKNPTLEGSKGEPVTLSGPYPDGIISVHRASDQFPGAKLTFDSESGQWVQDLHRAVYLDKSQKAIVDIRAAIDKANEMFPKGPERKAV